MTANSKNNAREVEIAELTGIMQSKSGRNVIRRILDMTRVFSDTFSPDPLQHAYNAGLRKVGLKLITELEEATPGEYQTLLRERSEDGN